MLERPPRCRVPDDENAGAGEARTHVAEEVAHALDGVAITFPARKRLIDGLPPERCHTLDWAAVQHPVVAFAEACVLAKVVPEVVDVPTRMALSTKVLRKLARGAIDPIVTDEPKMPSPR